METKLYQPNSFSLWAIFTSYCELAKDLPRTIQSRNNQGCYILSTYFGLFYIAIVYTIFDTKNGTNSSQSQLTTSFYCTYFDSLGSLTIKWVDIVAYT
jgi:hypothetical protein